MATPHFVSNLLRLTLTLGAAIATVVILKPEIRNALIAEMNDPSMLPAFESDPRIHFEPSARACAQTVATLLPKAIAKIEAEHGRRFSIDPIIGVYSSFAAFAQANGLQDEGIAGVSRAGRAILSPVLCQFETYRLNSVLTHELSHVHLFGWRGRWNRPPQWFTEGLAVMASDGGAAESVSDADAADAIRRGAGIILNDTPWTNFAEIPFAAEPCPPDNTLPVCRQRLAYRQASIFLRWLRQTDGEAFSRLMRALEDGADFDRSFIAAYGAPPMNRWRDFAASLHASR